MLTFHYVCLCWIFFRSPTFGQALAVMRQIATLTTFHPNLPTVVLAVLGLGVAALLVPRKAHDVALRRFAALPAVAQGVLLFVVAIVLHEAASVAAVPFVYFQF